MSKTGLPLSRRLLDMTIERLSSRFGEAQRIRRAVANTIVAQLMPDCVIKGGSSLKFRYGDIATRVTKGMDAAQGDDLDAFIARLDAALHTGWSGFTGHVVRREPASPEDVPTAYVMHPFDVKLNSSSRRTRQTSRSSGTRASGFSHTVVVRHGRQGSPPETCGRLGTRPPNMTSRSSPRSQRRLSGLTN